jgi:hypothetical protein
MEVYGWENAMDGTDEAGNERESRDKEKDRKENWRKIMPWPQHDGCTQLLPTDDKFCQLLNHVCALGS